MKKDNGLAASLSARMKAQADADAAKQQNKANKVELTCASCGHKYKPGK